MVAKLGRQERRKERNQGGAEWQLLRQSSASSFKNKHTASTNPLSLIQRLVPHRFTAPPIHITKQCPQTPTSPSASQTMEARPRTSAAAAAALVASSAAAPTDPTLPQRPNRRKKTGRRPRQTPRTQSSHRKTERLPRAHYQARAVRTLLMSTSASYSKPSQLLAKASTDYAPQQLQAHRA